MSAATERDHAMQVARTDFKRALSLASNVSDSWYACQALASVARYAPDEHVVRIAEKAIVVGKTATDSYRRVAPLAWPLRALIERDHVRVVLRWLPELLTLCARVENPISRGHALFVLWEAVLPIPEHKLFLKELAQLCSGHWHADYLLREGVVILASQDKAEAERFAALMPPGKYQRQAEKRLAQGQTKRPRQFF